MFFLYFEHLTRSHIPIELEHIISLMIGNIFSSCDRIGLNEALPLRKWISRGMTGMFRSQHLTKVLDKVVAGSLRVLVFLALALVEHSRLKIRESENAYEAVGKMTAAAATASEDTESRIISIALERSVYNHSMFLSKQIRL